MSHLYRNFSIAAAVHETIQERYPHIAATTAFADNNDLRFKKEKLYGAAGAVVDLFEESRIHGENSLFGTALQRCKKGASSYYYYLEADIDLATRGHSIIAIDDEGFGSHRAEDAFFAYDHELGHRLLNDDTPAKISNRTHYREFLADSYAAIRSVQRYGLTGFLHVLDTYRALEMIDHNDYSHLTTAVVQKIIADAPSGVFNDLSPSQTLATARLYTAVNYDETLSKATTEHYKKVQNLCVHTQFFYSDIFLDKFAETVLSAPTAHAFHIGRIAFMPFMNGTTRTTTADGAIIKVDTGYTDDKKKALTETFNKRAEKFGLPAVPALQYPMQVTFRARDPIRMRIVY